MAISDETIERRMQELRETAEAFAKAYAQKEFLVIPSWPAYEIAIDGEIRRILAASGAKIGRTLKQRAMQNGYMVVTISMNSKTKTHLVHRLVAEAWIGRIPAGLDVCHNDGNRANNHALNLRFGTRKENMQDTIIHGTTNRGVRCGSNKYPESMILDIRARHDRGNKARQISIDLGIPIGTVWGVVRRDTWKWL